MSPAQGWGASNAESATTSSSEALRERYVERTLEKILRLQRQPATRPMDLVLMALLVLTMALVFFRTGHGGPVVSDAAALKQIGERLDTLKTQQQELHQQLAELKAIEHDMAALKARPPVAVLAPPPAPSASPAVVVSAPVHAPSPDRKGPKGEQVHVLQPGESLWSISQKYYGDAALLNALAKYNGIDDPSAMRVGMSVKIPPLATLHAHPPEAPSPAAAHSDKSPARD